VIRKAKISDVPIMNHLRLQVRENMLSDPGLVTEQMTREAITRLGRGWVFEENGSILGFSIALDESRSVWALFVLPAHEGQGIGHQLLEAAVSWLWTRGSQRIWLSTDPGTRAESFYRDRGWLESGICENGEIRFELAAPDGVG